MVFTIRSFSNASKPNCTRSLAIYRRPKRQMPHYANNGSACVLALEEVVERANEVAPEHLHFHGAAAESLADRARNYGALFIGSGASEVFGDYGAGPNHVLPTSGTARFSSGLSVFTFLEVRTFMEATGSPDESLVRDTTILPRAEGLLAHSRAAAMRFSRAFCDVRRDGIVNISGATKEPYLPKPP